MAFTFPLNPVQNQIAVTPLGQRYIYMSAEEGWRSVGINKSPSETVGLTISSTIFFVDNETNLSFSSVAILPSSGVNPPLSYTVASGQLPSGLSLNNGAITGSPTVANETYSFMISILDSAGYLVNTILFNGQVSSLVTADSIAPLLQAVLGEAISAAPFASLNSPTFVGTPRVPTPPGSDNSSMIATTAFVSAALSPEALIALLTNGGTSSPLAQALALLLPLLPTTPGTSGPMLHTTGGALKFS